MIPNKLQRGQQFKPSVVDKINQIIDYLKTQRIIGDNKTIKVNQLTNSIALTALSNGTRKGGGSSQIDHPFKLKIGTLQNETSGDSTPTSVLKISQARIIVSGDEASRIYFCYDDNDVGLPTHLNLPEKDGEYNVVGYAAYDDNAPQNEMNALGWGAGCIYADYVQTDTSDFTESCGFFTFTIGTVKVETDDEGNKKYSITRQLLFSSLDVHDCNVLRDFRGHWQKQTYPTDGEIVESLIADKFIINQGNILSDGQIYNLTEYEQSGTPSEQNLFCVKITSDKSVIEYAKVNINQWKYFDEQGEFYLIPICLTYPSNSSAVGLSQFIEGVLIFNVNGKILLNQTDQVPSEYFQDKLKYQTKEKEQLGDDEKKYFTSGGTYIIGITTDANEKSTTDPKLKNLYDELYWDWTSINDFDDEKKQALTHDNGNLAWAPIQYDISGSLAEWMSISELSGENLLYWKPEFDTTTAFDEQCYLMASVKKTKPGALRPETVLSGLSWGTENDSKDALLSWNLSSGMPEIKIPPSNSTQVNGKAVSSWVLVGNKEDGLNWTEYETSNFSLSGSLENHFEIVPGTSGNVLVWKDEFDQNAQGINYIVTQDYEGKFTKATWMREGNEKQGVMIWNFDDSPAADINISVPPPETTDYSTFVLAGNETSGLSWIPYESSVIGVSGSLADIIELAEQPDGTKALQVISEYDGSVDQFSFLILDEMGCIDYFSFYDSGGAVAGLMVWDYNKKEPYITVPPAAVEDDHWFLEGTQENGVGWTSLGESVEKLMLAKLVSQEDSIMITQSTEYEGSINLDINPAYFFSSDESISIEQGAEGGLDFTVNAAAQLESPEESIIITPPAEGAEDKTTTLEINPDYFTSSDESIAITDAGEGGGLDFTVNVTTQLESPEESIIITPPAEGAEDKTIQIEINPDYFTSSDESIAITDAGEGGGLDFTVNVTTQLESPDESLIITPPAEGAEDKTIQIEINPDYFTSSDKSISITDANEAGGLDFTVNVTTQLESPDESLIVTPPAEDAEDKTIQIEINPDYFTSSDESIAITDAGEGGGLDFTVNITTKLESPNNSITITPPAEGAEDKTIKIDITPEYFTSNDQSVIITASESGIDFSVEAAVELESPNNSITVTPPAEGAEDKTIKIDITPEYFTSNDQSVIITAGESGIDFSVEAAVELESPNNSLTITPPAEGSEDKTIKIDITPEYFTSNDQSVIITAGESGIDFSVEATAKLESEKNSIIITEPAEGATDPVTTLDVNPAYFTSSDQTVDISDTGSAIDFIIPDLYKVKVSESDTAPGYLPSKLVVDASAAGLIQLVVEGTTLKIKSALTGNGLMVINNGNVSVLAAPTGNAVLVCKNGVLSWVEYNDCENACN